MKLAFQLAYKNLIGAGLRTWLNVIVLAFAFIMIIFFNSIMDGWNNQAKEDSIAWDFGNGQLVSNKYDKFDAFTFQDGHSSYPKDTSNLTPILIQQATIYPENRLVPIILKGIPSSQSVLAFPTEKLNNSKAEIPVLIGERMAKSNNLEEGETLLMRWRDENGTFDAKNITVVGVFKTNVSSVDKGQFWIDLATLEKLTGLKNQASLFIANENYENSAVEGFTFISQKSLMRDLDELAMPDRVASAFLYLLLLVIALLAVFDTQVLSIFRRQKEIGTYIALGMTKKEVLTLFTIEGTMYSIFAVIFGTIFCSPLFYYLNKVGINFNVGDEMGIAMADRIYPSYSLFLIVGTIELVIVSATIVSFIPAAKIVKMNPVDALKGKIQ